MGIVRHVPGVHSELACGDGKNAEDERDHCEEEEFHLDARFWVEPLLDIVN
jgi:hypothetical protein